MASLFLHGSRLLTLLSIQSLLLLCTTLAGAQSVPATYVFGDSIVDVGNNNYLYFSFQRANYPQYGIDYPGKKATGRFSNGKNVADFIAEGLGVPTAPPYLSQPNSSFVNGTSFASGGAAILNGTETNLQNLPLAQQSEYFSTVRQRIVKELLSDSAAQQHFNKSLFIVLIGSNDIAGYFNNLSTVAKKYTPQQYVDLLASTLKNMTKGIYDMGARKFIMLGVPPVGCAPQQRSQTGEKPCNDAMNTMCQNFNVELLQLLTELKSQLTDFQYTYLDTYGVINETIQNPTNYGFREIKYPCCGLGRLGPVVSCTPVSLVCSNRSEHFFWDLYFHPTEEAAGIFVGLLLDGTTKYATPITVQQLIAV